MSTPKDSPRDRGLVRLQKVLAAAGFGSRRRCEEFIETGRVTVDGRVVSDLGAKVDPAQQEIRLDGEPVKPERKQYFMLNKPKGVVSTNRDPAGRPRIIDLFPKEHVRLFPVGRLDENSQGLILVTNDGELGNKLAHPRYQIPKVYRVQVAGNPTRETLDQLRRGLHFAEGKFRVQGIRRISSRGKSTFLEIVLNEGQNREIRRLLARVGHKVMHLERVGFGTLRLGHLAVGRFRPLKPAELASLRELVARRKTHTEDEETAVDAGGRRRGKAGEKSATRESRGGSRRGAARSEQSGRPSSGKPGSRRTGTGANARGRQSQRRSQQSAKTRGKRAR